MKSNLSSLQVEFLHVFFGLTRQFYLTGGGALIGYYQWQRKTEDLDLFSASQEAFERVDALMASVSASLKATKQQIRSSPYFYRYLLERGDESLQVDLVYESSPQLHSQKAQFDGVMVDVVEEIFANKICTLVHRAEPRDFWDVYQFVQRGFSLDTALENAAVKEGGVDAESLVLVLSDINWEYLHKGARKAGLDGFDHVEAFFKTLIPDLARRLLPPQG